MNQDALALLRREASAQLSAYRQSNVRGVPRRGGGVHTRDALWVLAITSAINHLKETNPVKARLLTRLFGLEKPIPRYQRVRERVIQLSMEYNVSETTVYAWREDLIHLVVCAAIEAGAARPFGIQVPSEADGAAEPDLPSADR